MSVWPSRQAPAGGVGDDDRDVAPGAVGDRAAEPARRGVGVVGEQERRVPGSTLEASTPAAAIVRPSRFTTIDSGPRRATDADASRRAIASSRSTGDDPALGLAHDLAGHARRRRRRPARRSGSRWSARSSPGRTSPTPSGGPDRDHGDTGRDQRHRGRGHRRGGVGVGHQQGTAAQAMPGRTRPARPRRRRRCRPASRPGRRPPSGRRSAAATPRRCTSTPIDVEQLVGHAAHVGRRR